MDRTPRGRDDLAEDPLPYVRGLCQLIPEGRLAAILSRTGRSSERRRLLPADAVVWLVVAMALFAADSIPKVWRRLHPSRDHPEPTDSAFSQARRRLGVAPLRHLFHETARPMATHQTVGAFYRGWRLMGIDGTTLDLPDTPENARTFGRPTTGRAEGASPQVRLLALCELGTHAVCGLSIKPICHGEVSMVGPLLDHLGPGDLLVWDRGFFSYGLIRSVVRRGARLLARVKSNTVLRPIRRLSDGSYLAKVYLGEADRRHDTRGITVRVVEYTHDDPIRSEPARRGRAAPADHRLDQPAGHARERGAPGLPRAVGTRTRVRRDQDPPERPGGADPEQGAGGRGAGGLRPGPGALRGAAGDARRGGCGQPGPRPVVVHRLPEGAPVPAPGVTGRKHGEVVSATAAGGAAAEAAPPAGPLVCSGHQTKDVELDEEAARASEPAAADQTLSRGGGYTYLKGIGASPRFVLVSTSASVESGTSAAAFEM